MKPHKYTPGSLFEIDNTTSRESYIYLPVEATLAGPEGRCNVSKLIDHMPDLFVGHAVALGDVDGMTRRNMARNHNQLRKEHRAGIIRGDPAWSSAFRARTAY